MRKQKINRELIERLVSEKFGVGVYSIRKLKNRQIELIEAKYVCYYFIYKYMFPNKSKIGNMYGRNHASIINALHKVNGWIDTDPYFRDKVNSIEEVLVHYNQLTILENGKEIH